MIRNIPFLARAHSTASVQDSKRWSLLVDDESGSHLIEYAWTLTDASGDFSGKDYMSLDGFVLGEPDPDVLASLQRALGGVPSAVDAAPR